MSQKHTNDQGMVDLLEIYHARQQRDEILTQLRRLRVENPLDPFHDHVRKREIKSYYEAALLSMVELLRNLGDEVPRI
jgi:hypothetical protein